MNIITVMLFCYYYYCLGAISMMAWMFIDHLYKVGTRINLFMLLFLRASVLAFVFLTVMNITKYL